LREPEPAAIVSWEMRDYDLVVIGSGPAGQKAAVQAAKLRRRVAVVECRDRVGGVCMNTGTIPSKTLREAALYLTGLSQRSLYGQSYRVKENITIEDLLWRTQHVIDSETDVVRGVAGREAPLLHRGGGERGEPDHVADREISFVGRTEGELTDAAIPYEAGISRYHELARG
jgi:NAD(P) transhydrogenase